jgi:CubicO group peptidase (beta-lactamase class C family)
MKILLSVTTVLLSYRVSFSQVEKGSGLFQTIASRDSVLFDAGFNALNTKVFANLLSDKFECYHDEAGITATKADFIASIERLTGLDYTPRRELVENTLEVYPLRRKSVIYGAIQTGEHRFYARLHDSNNPEVLTSTAKFTHLWLLEKGEWKLSLVLSYDHHDTDSANSIPHDHIFRDRLETEKWMIDHHIPTLGIGYIEEGKIKEEQVFGTDENGKPEPDNTMFDVASLTKPVTAMVVMKLVNSGKWDLDEPLFHYWTDPDVANDPRSKRLTTRHVLSHQSGFPNWRDGSLVFEFEPGAHYQYSGEGFEYLRRALEKRFNKPLDQLANELIFEPLNMHDTHYYWDKSTDTARIAKRYSSNGGEYATHRTVSANAANHLLTTVEDYCKFMVYVMNGAGIDSNRFHQMISEQARIKRRKYFGLGWWLDEHVNGDENAIVHGGDDKGVHTIAFMLPKSKQGLLIFTNCDNGTDTYIPIIQHFLPDAVGKEIIDVETK